MFLGAVVLFVGSWLAAPLREHQDRHASAWLHFLSWFGAALAGDAIRLSGIIFCLRAPDEARGRKMLWLSAGAMLIGWIAQIVILTANTERLDSWHLIGPLAVLTVAGPCLSWFGVVAYIEQLSIFAGCKDLALFARIWLYVGAIATLVAEGTMMLLMAVNRGSLEESVWSAPLGIAAIALGLEAIALFVAWLILIAAMWFALAPPLRRGSGMEAAAEIVVPLSNLSVMGGSWTQVARTSRFSADCSV